MARTPIDTLPQRELLERLRAEIPRAVAGRRVALRRVDALVEANPHSWASTYVAYNLGKRKFSWLWSHVEATRVGALPRRGDAGSDSLAKIYGWIDQSHS